MIFNVSFDIHNKYIKVLQQDGYYIAICNFLNISDFGNSEEEARNNLNKQLEILFSYMITEQTLYNDLDKNKYKLSINDEGKIIISPK